jgi:hypothetical protein
MSCHIKGRKSGIVVVVVVNRLFLILVNVFEIVLPLANDVLHNAARTQLVLDLVLSIKRFVSRDADPV